MQRILSRAASPIVAALLIVPAYASEGRVPIFEPGTVIAADGTYVVTRNLTAASGPVITITAEHVRLDLNGFVLSTGYSSGPIIQINGGYRQHVTIRNGQLTVGSAGIETNGVTQKLTIEDVTIHDIIPGQGIHMGNVETAVIRRVEIRDTQGDGILWDGTQDKEGAIEDSLIRGAARGIAVRNTCLSLSIAHNRIEQAVHGIELYQCRGSRVADNVVSLTSGSGIRLLGGWGNIVSGNSVSDNYVNGIHVDANSSSNLIRANTCTHNGGLNDYGMRIDGSYNKIEGNVINENYNGLVFTATSCGNTFSGNMARGNAGFISGCTASPALFPPNSCNMGSSCGIPNTSFGDNLIPGPPAF